MALGPIRYLQVCQENLCTEKLGSTWLESVGLASSAALEKYLPSLGLIITRIIIVIYQVKVVFFPPLSGSRILNIISTPPAQLRGQGSKSTHLGPLCPELPPWGKGG